MIDQFKAIDLTSSMYKSKAAATLRFFELCTSLVRVCLRTVACVDTDILDWSMSATTTTIDSAFERETERQIFKEITFVG